MPITFHILDALSRDQITTITRETDEEQEVEMSWQEDGEKDKSFGQAGQSPQQRALVIHLFGMTAEGESLRCDVEGFRPYLYVKVGPSYDIHQFRDQLKTAERELNSGQQLTVPASLSIERVKRKELYGFTADEEFTFFKLEVSSLKDFRNLKQLLLNDYQEPAFRTSKKSAPLPVYESGLDPLLRFFHLRNV